MPNALFGSYLAADTPVHRLDARVKIALLLVATAAAFLARSWMGLVLLAAIMLAVARLAGVSPSSLARSMRPAALILLFALIANAFVLDGTGDVALVGPLSLTWAGLGRGLVAVGRVLVLVGLALCVTATTAPPQMADALSSIMSPLRVLRVPVGDIAMVVSVALRFIPLCAEEFGRIRDAQRARGVDFDAGGLPARLRRWLSVLTPLVVALFRRADDLAAAMRERCYRGEGRTRLARGLRHADVVALVMGILACLAVWLV